jgi:hypothetical protein
MDAKETVKQILDILNHTDEVDKKLLKCMAVAYSSGLTAGYQMNNNNKEG